MNKKILLTISVITLLVGCAVTPNQDAIGPYPHDYDQILKSYVLRTYFDPYSIRSVSVSSPPFEGHIFFQQGWIVCLESNAKNRMGGYTGLQRTAYLINGNNVVQTMEKAPLCNDPRIYYSPWPELEQMK